MKDFRKQNRLTKYDYSQPGYYFVTICTKNRIEYFGHIENGKMVLNDLGQIAHEAWARTPDIYLNVSIDKFVVMPNHIHGIVIIETTKAGQGPALHLSQIIGSYKNVVSKAIRKITSEFFWQPSFYDHVIRKEESLDKIREYIFNNPLKWELDTDNPSNVWL